MTADMTYSEQDQRQIGGLLRLTVHDGKTMGVPATSCRVLDESKIHVFLAVGSFL